MFLCNLVFYLAARTGRDKRGLVRHSNLITSQRMHLSKMTAAVLDDLNYIVDPSTVRFDAVFAVNI